MTRLRLPILILVLGCATPGPPASSQTLELRVEPESLRDERAPIRASASIRNVSDGEVDWVFETYFRSSDARVPVPRRRSEPLRLAALQERTVELEFARDWVLYGGTYELRAEILEASDYRLVERTAQEIVLPGPLPPPRLEVRIARDPGFREPARVFAPGETVYLDVRSDVADIETEADLTLPDGTTRQLSLPASIIAEQAGDYALAIRGSKEGYAAADKRIGFAVTQSARTR
jgi:hypothetical protein